MSDSGGEAKTFVFLLSVIVIFAGLLITMPTDFQGQGDQGTVVTPLDSSLTSSFAEAENWTRTDFVTIIQTTYVYSLGGYTFLCEYSSETFSIGAKVLYFGVWLGQLSYVNFISPTGENLGTTISFDDIEDDATEGVVSYTLQFEDSGNSAGSFIVGWNTTLYSDPSDAWDNDVLYLVHGFGFEDTAVINVTSLLIGLLFFQLPDVPFLINLILGTFIWASAIYIIWFIFIKSTPFLG